MTLNLLGPEENDPHEEAARWFARWRSGQMNDAGFEAIEAWFKSHPDNRRAFQDVAAIWEEVEGARRDPVVMILRENARRSMRRNHVARLARQAAAILLVGVLAFGLGHLATGVFETKPDLYATRLGQTSTMRLADGSKVTLDTDSELKVWVRQRGERRLELVRGRAFFDVASHPTRPFVVHTNQGSVTAVGTSFDVRKEANSLRVALVEGRVRIKPSLGGQKDEQVEMTAGHQYIGGAKSWQVMQHTPPFEVSWVTGELIFDDEPLSTIVEEMNRYTPRKIIITDEAVGQRRLSAVLKLGDAETFLSSVQILRMAQVQTTRGREILLTAPK